VDEAAEQLAELLREERADILLGYDPQGGYGHRDHVRVYEVAVRAAELAETPRLLQATVPRELVVRAFDLLRALRLVRRYDPAVIRGAYSPQAAITHRIDVRRFAGPKRASLACHASELRGSGRPARLFRLLAALPTPVFGLLLGREWFVESAVPSGSPVRRDLMK
jgi:LmbE family N-acetylglucosaminyl deacetylase